MSKRNGDRSRAHREQQKKLLRRKRTLEIRQDLQTKSQLSTAPDAPAAETKTAHAD